jgi:hypothetical protein
VAEIWGIYPVGNSQLQVSIENNGSCFGMSFHGIDSVDPLCEHDRTQNFSTNHNFPFDMTTAPSNPLQSPLPGDVENEKPLEIMKFEPPRKKIGKKKVEYKSLESLSNDFLSLINNKEYSDVTFIVGKDKKPVFAHRMILAKRSVYFRKLFESGMKESVDKEIEKSNISHTTFLVLMRYFYCGCLELNISNVLPVLAAADELTLSELKNFCVVFVTEHIDSDNALELLDMAYKYHSDVLIESCYEYIKNNSVDVLANDSFFKI